MPDPDKLDNKVTSSQKVSFISGELMSSRAFKDLVVIIVLSLISFVFAVEYNAFEKLYAFSRKHEHFDLDELFSLLMILSVALSVFSFRRVRELREEVRNRLGAEETVRKMAYYDSLTGLPNRTLLNDRLEHVMAQARRQKTQFAILFIDLDGFKNINDNLGHNYGDEVLQNVAQRMLAEVRDIDTVARFGGDEFIVLMESVKGLEEINIITRRIFDSLMKHHLLAGQKLQVTASIGIAVFPSDGDTCELLIKHADTAMYESKANGKGQIRFFNDDFNKQ
ncbi:MAG: GGDEF domain-containing protein [Gammaproteobacteria bacterium]|nr:GGDEF domain-containing protein [Gammaproteobacteria bacterium]